MGFGPKRVPANNAWHKKSIAFVSNAWHNELDHNMTPLAEFADGSPVSTFGKRKYRLLPDRVVVSGGRLGEKFETSISLGDIRAEPERLWIHSQIFRFGAVLAAVTLLLLMVTSVIFGNYKHNFTIWYLAGAFLVALGVVGCLAAFRSVHVIRFLSDKSGMPLLDVIAHRRSKRREQEVFVVAIQNQIVELWKIREGAAFNEQPQSPAAPDHVQ